MPSHDFSELNDSNNMETTSSLFSQISRYKKIILLATLGIVLLISIASFVIIYSVSKRSSRETIPINFQKALVIGKDYCKLTVLDIQKQKNAVQLDLKNINSSLCYFNFYMKKTIYSNHHKGYFESSSNLYPNLIVPFNSGYEISHHNYFLYTFSIDFINKKIYAIPTSKDIELDMLIVIDMVSNNHSIIWSNLDSPRYLAIDHDYSLIFIGQISTILRSSLDGTMPKKIVETSSVYTNMITGLGVDSIGKRIYWASLSKIESSNYEGGNRSLVIQTTDYVKAFDIIGNQLFWYVPATGRDLNAHVWTCILTSNTCVPEKFGGTQGMTTYTEPLLKAYDFDAQDSLLKSKVNPCEHDNGGCKDLCLLSNHSKGYSCACSLGYSLKEDLLSCQEVDEFLMYTVNDNSHNFVQGRAFDTFRKVENETAPFSDAIHPNFLIIQQDLKASDYNFQKNLIFFIDNTSSSEYTQGNLCYKSILPDVNQTDFVYGELTSVAHDWVTQNTYYTVQTKSISNWISVIRIKDNEADQTFKHDLYTIFSESLYGSINYLGSLAVHPNRGYLFYVMDQNDNWKSRYIKSEIYRMNTDGTDNKILIKKNYVRQNALAIDITEDRLYWFSVDGGKLKSSDLDGSSVWSTDISFLENPWGMAFQKDWIYLGNQSSIWQISKTTEKGAQKVIGSIFPESLRIITTFKVFSRQSQPVTKDHPCAERRGGCQKFCYGIPSETGLVRSCGCENAEKIQLDGRTCLKQPR